MAKLDKETVKLLQEIVSTSLAGPGGDPDSSHCWAAAYATIILRNHGVKVHKDWITILRKDNVHNNDFLSSWEPRRSTTARRIKSRSSK
jgi:hypothetical protein